MASVNPLKPNILQDMLAAASPVRVRTPYMREAAAKTMLRKAFHEARRKSWPKGWRSQAERNPRPKAAYPEGQALVPPTQHCAPSATPGKSA